MRTKTLLLAAAALAAGLFNSQAQTPVYSQNIVGYANYATPSSGTYYLMSVPFQIGVSNGANEVFGLNANPSALPIGTEILTWNVGSQSYTISFYDPTQSPPWFNDPNEDANVSTPDLPVGSGFFLLPGGSGLTNTFAGTVAVSVGATNTMTLPNSGTYYLVGSPIPYAGAITNSNGINLNGLPVGTEILTWSVLSQSYTISFYDPTQSPPWFNDPNEDANVPVPSANVGDGFFVLPAGSYTWTNSLPAN
jgi:hypothetical protein